MTNLIPNVPKMSDAELLCALDHIRQKDSLYASLQDVFVVKIETDWDDLTLTTPLADCELVSIILYYWKPTPPVEQWQMQPLIIEGYTFNFDVHVFPHQIIRPNYDKLLENLPWKSKFGHGQTATTKVSEVCQVIRDLDQMASLKGFW